MGLAVSRKVGNAVERNRVKRWIREAARRLLPELQGTWDLVIQAAPPSANAGAQAVATEVRAAFGRIQGMRT